ncbi:MAG TPA: Stf0 family sulfotransferase [Blastocatellia bacterium]|nr:Stf0 family sulfotransferase [Blastocatellia bacterium]
MQVTKRTIPPNTNESRYDLSTTRADYPDWNAEKPLRTFVLCSHTRSGSTLLSEAMHQAGGMGCPVEYFHFGFQPTLENMWGADGLDSYIRAIYKHRTDPSGSLGIKIFWMDVLDLCVARYPEEKEAINTELEDRPEVADRVYGLVRNIFADIFPNPQYIFLTRRDRLRHAISSLISGQVRIYRDISGATKPAPAGEPTYDYDAILNRIRYYAYCDARWNEFFESAGIKPHRVTYEELAVDYTTTVKNMLVAMDNWHSEDQLRAPRLRRQASRLSEEFAWRFLEEHSRRTSENESETASK